MSKDVKDFLRKIAQLESAGGKYTNHRKIESGMHAGHRGIGTYALMPNTVDEVAKRTGDPELKELVDMDPVTKKEYLESRPELQEKIAARLASHVLKRQKDPEKAAYTWLYGHNLDPKSVDERDYKNDSYVQKFNKLSGMAPKKQAGRSLAASNDLFAPPTPEEDKKYGIVKDKPKSQKQEVDLFAPPTEEEDRKYGLAKTPEPTQDLAQRFNEWESGGLGAVQGATLGFADEIEGGLKALFTDKTYSQARDEARDRYNIAQTENPKSFMGGNIAGGVATSLFPGVNIAKSATLGAAALKAGALGAATGLGSSKADLSGVLQGDTSGVEGAAIDTAIGGVLGAGTGYAGQKISQALTPAATQTRAATRMVKALGEKALPENLPMGKAVLDEGAAPIFGGSKAILDKITGKIGEIENKTVKPIFQKITEADKLGDVVKKQIPIDEVVKELAEQSKAMVPDISSAASTRRSIEDAAAHYTQKLMEAAGNPEKLNVVRKLIDKEATAIGVFLKKGVGYNPELKPRALFLSNLRNEVNNYLRNISSEVSPKLGEELTEAITRQSPLAAAKTAAQGLVKKDMLHPPGSIMDTFRNFNPAKNPRAALIAGSYYLSNPWAKGGLALGLGAEKITKQPVGRLANIMSARTQHSLANSTIGHGILKVGEEASRYGSRAIPTSGVQTGIQNLYGTDNEKLTQVAEHFAQQPGTESLANALNSAIVAGDEQAKNRVLFAMEQRPDVREQLRELLATQEEMLDNELLTDEYPRG